jgi:phosphatidylglycerophosphatase C
MEQAMTPVAVFDLDQVLLDGDATATFLATRLRQAPGRALPALLATPVLLAAAAVPRFRPLSARALTRLLLAGPGDGRPDDSVVAIAEVYRAAVARRPELVVADALARLREHAAAGDLVVVATGSEETLARGLLTAVGLGDVEVVGSTAALRPPRSRRAVGEAKVRMLTERGYPPPWTAVYSDSPADLPLFAGTPRPVLVNAGGRAVRQVARVLGRAPGTATWR